jgi:hypothetical protein
MVKTNDVINGTRRATMPPKKLHQLSTLDCPAGTAGAGGGGGGGRGAGGGAAETVEVRISNNYFN